MAKKTVAKTAPVPVAVSNEPAMKERCIYCGHIFTEKEKLDNNYIQHTKPTMETGTTGGHKIIDKVVGFQCKKRCFKGMAVPMHTPWVEAVLRNGEWVDAKRRFSAPGQW